VLGKDSNGAFTLHMAEQADHFKLAILLLKCEIDLQATSMSALPFTSCYVKGKLSKRSFKNLLGLGLSIKS
jgi:hypothetical protein